MLGINNAGSQDSTSGAVFQISKPPICLKAATYGATDEIYAQASVVNKCT